MVVGAAAASERHSVICPEHSPRMNTAEIRRAFADFCGTDRYRQFVAAIWSSAIPKQRLIYWQEQLWRAFAESCSAPVPSAFGDLLPVFEVCPRHLEPLHVVDGPKFDAIAESRQGVPEDDRDELYPFAVIAVTQGGVTRALSCPACVSDLESRTPTAVRPGK
jgi:hypothetical protein